MTMVKPPSLPDLVRIYGSLKDAVNHLVNSGFTAEEIEWRFGIPYHIVRLLIAGFQPKGRLLFSDVIKVYDRLVLLRSRKGKETELANFLKREDLFILFDDIRYKRNALTYYGKRMDFETAKQAIENCKKIINELQHLTFK